MGRTGVWLLGARGSVATTAVLGAFALREGAAEPTGCVTARPEFGGAGLPGIDELVFGGHDLSDVRLCKTAERLARRAARRGHLPGAFADPRGGVGRALRRGLVSGDGPGRRQDVRHLEEDLGGSAERDGAGRTVVIDLTSTEAGPEACPEHE